jgi:hypothetical protein
MRIISLGICPVRRLTLPDQRRGGSASDRETPLITGVNGTLMARPAGAGLYRHGALFLPRHLDRDDRPVQGRDRPVQAGRACGPKSVYLA